MGMRMKKNYWWLIAITVAFASTLAHSDTHIPPNVPTEPKATATYGNPLVYSDGEVLIKKAAVAWVDSGGVSGSYDMGLSVRYCPASSGYTCVQGGFGYDFAIPRRTLHVGESWKFNGVTFLVLPSAVAFVPGDRINNAKPLAEISLLGQKLSFYVIAMMGRNGNIPIHLFLFSPERGLIGDADPAEGAQINTNWLQEGYGPGSKEFDSHIATSVLLSQSEVSKMLKEDGQQAQ